MTAASPAIAAARPGVRLGSPELAQLAAALVAFAVVLFAPGVFNDGDTYWHLAAGDWMLTHGQILRRDVFSYSHAGQPWITHEWLTELAMAAAFRLGSWSGLLILAAAAAAAAAALIARGVSRSVGGITVVSVLILAAGCLAPSVLVRPHLLVLPVLVGWIMELLAASETRRAPHWWLAPLMLAWANLHGSYVFGLLFYAILALEAVVNAPPAERRPTLVRWGRLGAACGAMTLITPHGWSGLVYPFQIMGMGTLDAIVEWRPADFSHISLFAIALLATIFVCLARGVRVPPIRLAGLMLLLFMALQHGRHQFVLAAVAPLILARPLAEALGQRPPRSQGGRLALAAFGGAAALMVLVRLALPAERGDDLVTPAAALAHVPPELAAKPVFNSYSFGGDLIFRGVKPFIDGRSDMYGDAYFRRYLKIAGGDMQAFDAAARQYGVAWTILTPKEKLVTALDAAPGWRRVYSDEFAVIHVRTSAAPATADGLRGFAR